MGLFFRIHHWVCRWGNSGWVQKPTAQEAQDIPFLYSEERHAEDQRYRLADGAPLDGRYAGGPATNESELTS